MVEKLFITGKLAYPALKKTLHSLGLNFEYEIIKMPITVAALMDSDFIIKHLKKEAEKHLKSEQKIDIIIPGRSRAELSKIRNEIKRDNLKFLQGPDEIMDLAEYFGKSKIEIDFYKKSRKHKILAEINEASLMKKEEIVKKAEYYHNSGADIIDLGCVNGREFNHLEEVIYLLKEKGYQLSIDTFDQNEVIRAAEAGIDYLLSINSHNISVVNSEISYLPVIIPDPESGTLDSLLANINQVEKRGVNNYIIDPILDPINFGFSDSLFRYLKLSQNKDINKAMMMGVGNLIELSDCDSIGLNFIAAAFAVELDIEYLLTTEASFKTKGAVRELDLALKIISYAGSNNSLPNNISDLLLNIKDRKNQNFDNEEIKELAASITDSNYRILNDGKNINIFNGTEYYQGTNIDLLFSNLSAVNQLSHAFYLGKELQKAYTAINLAKNYRQEDELSWGYLNKNFKGEKNDNRNSYHNSN